MGQEGMKEHAQENERKEGQEMEKNGVGEYKFLLDHEYVLEQLNAEFVLFPKLPNPTGKFTSINQTQNVI